jgi:FAD/FMN-containing dehydrogenase
VSGAADDLVEVLAGIVGAAAVLTASDDLAYYGSDRCRGGWPVAPRCIVLPRTVEQVQAVVSACAAAGAAIVPSGGRTGLVGAATATAGEVVVSLERMHRILEVDATGLTLRCEAGVTVEAVQRAAAEVGLMYPVDFAAKGTAQIGGSIATNAGGVRVLRYGSTRAWVLGLDVVVASGELLQLGGALVKDNTGYDLRQLFVGSEGTLGIVVGAVLRLCPPPAATVVALCAVPDEARLLDLFAHVRGGGVTCSAFECFDAGALRAVLAHKRLASGPFNPPSPQHALVEFEVAAPGDAMLQAVQDRVAELLADAHEDGLVSDAALAGTPQQARDLWSLREDVSESLHRHRPHKSDVTLPIARLAEFVPAWRELVAARLPGAVPVIFGHIGDGNLHLNLLAPPDEDPAAWHARCEAFDAEAYALVGRFAGSVSAEHGIGLLKREHLHHTRSAAQVELMRAIKRALDPRGLFNPGKIFAPA